MSEIQSVMRPRNLPLWLHSGRGLRMDGNCVMSSAEAGSGKPVCKVCGKRFRQRPPRDEIHTHCKRKVQNKKPVSSQERATCVGGARDEQEKRVLALMARAKAGLPLFSKEDQSCD